VNRHFVCVFKKSLVLTSVSAVVDEITGLGRGYIGARTDTTQQSGQTPEKEAEMNHIAVYSAATLKPMRLACCLPTTADCLTQLIGFVSSPQSGQAPAAVGIGFECCCIG
jgi:hypothetical protein